MKYSSDEITTKNIKDKFVTCKAVKNYYSTKIKFAVFVSLYRAMHFLTAHLFII